MFGFGPFGHFAFGDVGLGILDPVFSLEGEAEVEFVGTTRHVELIESQRGEMSFFAIIQLRTT